MQSSVKKIDASEGRMYYSLWERGSLGFLALVTLIIGFWALFAPESFFTTFPAPGHPWVALLPPYNEHLTRDVGEFNLSFALLFIWLTVRPERRFIQVTLIAWLVYGIPHFIYHLNHLMHFAFMDQVGQVVSLGFIILLPLALLIFPGTTNSVGSRNI